MKHTAFTLIGSFLLTLVAAAQMPGGPPPDPCAALAKFFNKDAEFTASAKVVMSGGKSREQQLTVQMAVSGSNMRNELDMTKMSGVRSSDVAGMKQMGMDKLVILKLADQPATLMVFPNLQSYCDVPGPKNSVPEGALAKTEMGKDTVGSHACVKSKLVFTDKNGRSSEALVWEATDLKNFPVQYQTVDEGQTTTTTFTDVKMGKPAAALFQLPASFKKYDSMQAMMMGNMQRLLQQ